MEKYNSSISRKEKQPIFVIAFNAGTEQMKKKSTFFAGAHVDLTSQIT